MGEYKDIGLKGFWWSSFNRKNSAVWYRSMEYNRTIVYRDKIANNSIGYSVRCLKDN